MGPGAGDAGPPLVYDNTRCFLIVRRDFLAELSRNYAPAWEHYAVAFRLVGRFAVAIPTLANSIRQLEVGGTTKAAEPTKAAPATAPTAKK